MDEFDLSALPVALTLVSLTNGQRLRGGVEEFSGALVAAAQAWLLDGIWSRRAAPLPAPWDGYFGRAAEYGGGLVATIYEPGAEEHSVLTVGVAPRLSHGLPLWRVLTALPPAGREIDPPATPWCALLFDTPGAAEGSHPLLAFAQLCAEAWLLRPRGRRRRGVGASTGRLAGAIGAGDSGAAGAGRSAPP